MRVYMRRFEVVYRRALGEEWILQSCLNHNQEGHLGKPTGYKGDYESMSGE